jgi:NAD(P)H-dependent flavin oxidoreductase YrpB (nitropropane dioxygenase family)
MESLNEGPSLFDFIVLCPTGLPDASVPIAASRAGALGVVSLDLAVDVDVDAGLAQLRRLCALGHGRCGALLDSRELLDAVLGASLDGLDAIVLANAPIDELNGLAASAREAGLQVYVVATRLEEALAAEDAQADAIIAKGHETSGWIGDEGAFVLAQRLLATLNTPVYVHGGIGVHTVAGAYVAGAAGAVLDAQLLLTRESPLSESLRAIVANLDGSETATLGADLGAPFRTYSRPGLRGLALLHDAELELASSADALAQWRTTVKTRAASLTHRRRRPLAS